MANTTNKKEQELKKEEPSFVFFHKENYKWMLIGIVIITIGLILLSGGKNPNPNVFNTNLVYSTRRITVAPILIVIGFIVEIIAILKKVPSEKIG